MVGLTEMPPSPSNGLGFSVLHQKVELDIDFATRSLQGRTEITINPHFKELKTIRLNCRQCTLKRLNFNGRVGTSKYHDLYSNVKIHETAGVHQHHMLRQKLDPYLRDPPEEELLVNLPKSVRIEELDPFLAEAQSALLPKPSGGSKRNSGDVAILAATPLSKPMEEQGARFTPVTLTVEYTIDTIRDGLHFVGWEEGDRRYLHAYSRNSLFPGAACCLFPCVDDLSSRCTWELSIKCPRTLGDAIKRTRSRKPVSQVNGVNGVLTNGLVNGVNGDHDESMEKDDQLSGYSQEDQALDMAVICSGDLTDEILDPLDSTKKTVSFVCTTAVSAQHIGFAIGPFEHVDLSEFRETDEDEKLGQNAVRVHGFCLPNRAEEVGNTCLPMAKAIDYFTLTYGSYPFSSYKMCFVHDLVQDISDTASLSICSDRLLFPEDIIDTLDTVTRQLVHSLAAQWVGINIIPKEPTDTWVVIGIAYFITDMFMKKLCGNNEYRFRQKKQAELVCELDVARPSLFAMGSLLPLDPSELDFMALKAPLVLFILDRRLAKASGSSGLSRIISRLFLNAKVGDLPNSALTTAFFIKTCEKLGHTKLDVFFQQWVQGAGAPRFLVTQRFNKKKLVVEMLIKQVQGDQSLNRDLEVDTFMRDVKEEVHSVYAGPIQPVFTGPMTIRIHEADGTPYEHIVEIKDASTKFEIPYNTKYKRLKRSRRQKERAAAVAGIDIAADTHDDVLLYCLGDVLQAEDEVAEWRLTDWTKEDEDRMNQESYEWIRMDADFEWIAKMAINMPGYMYLSQLQQDRDVVAQYESIQYIAAQKEQPLISTILIRTIMDRRYFHGIRTAAIQALTKNAKDELDWIGLFHLEKAFQELFCIPNSPMTRLNDFSDRTAYYIQCAIPRAMARIRDHHGRAPMRVKRFLLDKLKFNDNTNNEFSDCYYVSTLMAAIAESLVAPQKQGDYLLGFDDEEVEGEVFLRQALDEIDRYRRMDEWISSYQNLYSTTALDCSQRLAKAKVIPTEITDYIRYARDGTYDPLRIKSFACLVHLGLLKNDTILQYFLFVLRSDPSPYVRDCMLHLFGKALALFAFGEREADAPAQEQDGLIIEQETSTNTRQAELARTQTVPGALAALKEDLAENGILQGALWQAVNSPEIGLFEMRELLDICSLLYKPNTSLIVKLKYPRYWGAEHIGNGKLRFHWTDIRTTPMPKVQIPRPPPAIKQDDSASSTAERPKIIFKSKKPPPHQTPQVQAVQQPLLPLPSPVEGKPKMTIKLKLPKGAGSS
ncbi:MAG: hypothetical protein M1835_006729 [Candelina submexicana]|nr:MAG: hypothetical protein M1835_006729 [Candelina submexicana]